MSSLVSIRMPKPLLDELKKLVHENHYLDLSEEVRSIIREQAAHYLEPTTQKEDKRHAHKKKKEELIAELKRLLEVEE